MFVEKRKIRDSRRVFWAALLVLCFLMTSNAMAQMQRHESLVNIISFKDSVVDIGQDTEDWQPAFQLAIQEAQETLRPIYIPAGEYKIRKAINISTSQGPMLAVGGNPVRLIGDGQLHSVIRQMVDEENVLNWTGPSYKKSLARGSMTGLTLMGGTIGLNIKWHNYFSMDSCYIHGAKKYGIYAEGYSSRFVNSSIRWCFESGIMGTKHFNDITIRDCYISRCGVGITMKAGYGVRITGTSIERCANSGIVSFAMKKLSITECYFEGNGNDESIPKYFKEDWGFPSQIHLDYRNRSVTIEDNIFRINPAGYGGLISIAHLEGGSIRNNFFQFRGNEIGILLKNACGYEGNGPKSFFKDIIATDNYYFVDKGTRSGPVKVWYAEETKDLFRKAAQQNCEFEDYADHVQVLKVPDTAEDKKRSKQYIPESD